MYALQSQGDEIFVDVLDATEKAAQDIKSHRPHFECSVAIGATLAAIQQKEDRGMRYDEYDEAIVYHPDGESAAVEPTLELEDAGCAQANLALQCGREVVNDVSLLKLVRICLLPGSVR